MSQLRARKSAASSSDVGVHRLAGNAWISLLLLLFCAAGIRPTAAQVVTATLTGTVRDSSGASIPNATVTATQTSTGVSRATKTTSDGVFNLPYLNPGTYRVQVEAKGFTTFVQNAISLEVSTVARLNATLNPGSDQQTVTVTAAPPALQTESAEVARNFNARITSEFPVANRNFQALAGLAAGVTPPVQSFTSIEDPQGTTFFNANGQGNSANNTLVDG